MICLSIEKPHREESGMKLELRRNIIRISYILNWIRIDLSSVEQITTDNDPIMRYELEIEFLETMPFSNYSSKGANGGFPPCLTQICSLIIDLYGKLYGNDMGANNDMNEKGKRSGVKGVYPLLLSKIASICSKLDLTRYRFFKPVDLSLKVIKKLWQGGNISYKLDGERRFVVFKDFTILSISTSAKVEMITFRDKSSRINVFDSELFNHIYYMFDMYIENDKNILHDTIVDRWKRLFMYCYRLNDLVGERLFVVKPMLLFNTYSEFVSKKMIISSMIDLNNLQWDGLIINILHGTNAFKWKPVPTIDLLYKDGNLYSYNPHKLEYVDFNNHFVYDATNLPNNLIIEFAINKGSLVYHRLRPDKMYPNSINTVTNILDNIQSRTIINNIINGYPPLALLRRYHNDVKRSLLEKTKRFFTHAILLDVGSGVGGDASKWKSNILSRIICVEPDAQKIPELKSRILNAGIEHKVDIINNKIEKIDLAHASIDIVSLFFCCTLIDIQHTIDIIDKVTKEGSYVLITTMSKTRVTNLLSNTFLEKRISYGVKGVSPYYAKNTPLPLTNRSGVNGGLPHIARRIKFQCYHIKA
ncbi:hypothetical protein K502DRAFT_60488 [Neoconidiobolus thromboides FSU 785]|nr:hypothetical protein K502DRAFT_60488 [Neoconidiobolus thromboides FSU 785]